MDRAPDDFVRAIAEQVLGAFAPRRDDAVERLADQRGLEGSGEGQRRVGGFGLRSHEGVLPAAASGVDAQLRRPERVRRPRPRIAATGRVCYVAVRTPREVETERYVDSGVNVVNDMLI